MNGEIVIVTYKPFDGMAGDLKNLVDGHTKRLQELELATNRQPIICQAEDGSILEIFEWASPEASSRAHEHPAAGRPLLKSLKTRMNLS